MVSRIVARPHVGAASLVLLLSTLMVAGPTTARAQQGAESAAAATEGIRLRLEAGRATGHLTALGSRILARNALPAFYGGREFRQAWVSRGRPLPIARELIASIRASEGDGLDPADYHLAAVESLMAAADERALAATEATDLDLLLTDAFLVLGSHLLQGRVNPELVEAEWLANRRNVDMAAVLDATLERAAADPAMIGLALDELRPPQPGYDALRDHLARLREAERAGGWGQVEPGPTLHPGDESPRVTALRRRLIASGDLAPTAGATSPRFDADVEAAVRRFQLRHGLEPDGVVGERSLGALNTPVASRIRQAIVNLERWRWLPQDLGQRHIRVNIAGFQTEVWERGETVLTLRSIVGRQFRQTPSFTGRMTYLVLAPYWNVPPTIASVDKLPLIKADPGYLAAQRMTLFDAATNQPVDPTSIDWAPISGAEFNRRFRIRQDPGPLNALGNVKFMFPNKHNVYLHDTPSRELFSQAQRDFSSGCIRIQNPLELAKYLLSDDPSWTEERMRQVIAAGVERSVNLPSAVPVHLLYWTAFADDEGRINFRADVYNRDSRVWDALRVDPPGP